MEIISTKEFNKLIKNKSKKELHELIIAGINEDIRMTDNQLLRLVKLKNERDKYRNLEVAK